MLSCFDRGKFAPIIVGVKTKSHFIHLLQPWLHLLLSIQLKKCWGCEWHKMTWASYSLYMNGIAVPSSGMAVPVRKPPLTAYQYIISFMTHRSCSLYFRRACDSTLPRVVQNLRDVAWTESGVVIGIRAGQPGDSGWIRGRGRGLSSSKKVPNVFEVHPTSHSVGGRCSTPEDEVVTHPHLVPT
jgi:hypothetical protein